MKTLIQKKNFVTRELRISEAKLFCKVSKFGNTNEIDMPFENIDGEKVSFKSSNNVLLLVSMGLNLLSIINLFLDFGKWISLLGFVIASILFVIYWLSIGDFWQVKLMDGNSILVVKDVPDTKTVDHFIDEIIKARNVYLRENFATIDENLDYESQLNNFKWLKAIKAITKEEFEAKHEELKKIYFHSDLNIGFNK
ncbi:hypothetical protein [Flavobacterium proteolyticum]|uniref:SMODS and SLOG-associating 2TM effector domain-containing protein n=1 Tax=Flavobacterium proteolyticum TaxID=2911683 RepID=A0ABR9WQ99_9FLAO|nr:hypothetical protein [Flavobacterium proteolyticum]MBE9576091.1 hypothetical protein [Flavobacterium proteolyticum]